MQRYSFPTCRLRLMCGSRIEDNILREGNHLGCAVGVDIGIFRYFNGNKFFLYHAKQ